ncbi:MarR family winged helix-turn-helix transcriptional regulator [Zhihengliuella flava]|uniref:DNA-binding MarR family transcriptional regulator n=1 Tax=Zhihengliuella flava TaxID=1285193 RepID=A0A931D4E2_9MICC|nr:DNA-binding MarR family transcriptional regulator [Zhihengliuella flava]
MNPEQRPDPRAALAFEMVGHLQGLTLASDRYADAVARADALHKTDLHALQEILLHQDAQAPLTASELGRSLHLSPPATTALIDRLAKHGHVERGRDARDRRRVTLLATDSARTTGSRLFRPLAQALGETASHYTPAELELINAFLAEALRTVEQATPPAP